MKTPTTTGQLRKMLAETMAEVRYGHMDPSRAIAVAKVAAQITQTITAEMNAQKLLWDLGVANQDFGALPLNTLPSSARTLPSDTLVDNPS